MGIPKQETSRSKTVLNSTVPHICQLLANVGWLTLIFEIAGLAFSVPLCLCGEHYAFGKSLLAASINRKNA